MRDTTLDLARSFGLSTIAEGVETHEQPRELTGLECDLAQGCLWSPPVAAEKVADVMENVGRITYMKVSPMRITRLD